MSWNNLLVLVVACIVEGEAVRATADGGAELAGDPKINIFTE